MVIRGGERLLMSEGPLYGGGVRLWRAAAEPKGNNLVTSKTLMPKLAQAKAKIWP